MSKFQQFACIFLLVSGVITLVAGETFDACVNKVLAADAFETDKTTFYLANESGSASHRLVDIATAKTLKGIGNCANEQTFPKSAAALKILKPLLPPVYNGSADDKKKIAVTKDTTDDGLAALLVKENIVEVCNPKSSTMINGTAVAAPGKSAVVETKTGTSEVLTYSAWCGGDAGKIGGGLDETTKSLKIVKAAFNPGDDATKAKDGEPGKNLFDATSVKIESGASIYLENDKAFTISAGEKAITFKGYTKIMNCSGSVLNHVGEDVTLADVTFYNVTCTDGVACIDAPMITNTEISSVDSKSITMNVIKADEISNSKIWNVNNADVSSSPAISFVGTGNDKAKIENAYISKIDGGENGGNAGGCGIKSTGFDILKPGNASVTNLYCIAGGDGAKNGVGADGLLLDKDITIDQKKLSPDTTKTWPDVCNSPPAPPVMPGPPPPPHSSFSSLSAQLLTGGFVLYVLSAAAKFM